jgi:predicted kinase
MDRLERKTNLFYLEYLPEIKDTVQAIENKGINVDELRRLIASIELEIRRKDYLAADQLISILQEELERKKIEAGIFDNTGLFW